MCTCGGVCVTKSAQGVGKLIFCVEVAHDGMSLQKWQNGVRGLDLENEVKQFHGGVLASYWRLLMTSRSILPKF